MAIRLRAAIKRCGVPGIPILPLGSLNPPIPILQPHNIIFSQIRPGLDLYELQGDGSGVFQGMDPLVTLAVPETTTQCSAQW